MSDLFAQHAATFKQFQDELGASCPVFTRGSDTFKIIPGSAMNNKPLRDGGFSDVFDVAFDVLFSEFSALFGYPDPAGIKNILLNTLITYQSQVYKIMFVTIAPNEVILTIGANSINQGA